MAIVNNWNDISTSSISLEDIQNAIDSTKVYSDRIETYNRYGDKIATIGNMKPEIYGEKLVAGSISADKIASNSILATKVEDKMRSTENPGYTIAAVGSYKDKLVVDYDEAQWVLEVPGFDKSDIEVFTVANKLTVKTVANEYSKSTFSKSIELLEDEKVTGTKLELGVLTITIDRPNKRQSITID